MGVNPSHFSPTGTGKDVVKDLDTSQHPVETVSWFDAIDFCNKLSEREQRSPYYVRDGEVVKVRGGTGYRLPTEAEWEYACRAGTTTRWSFGDNERIWPSMPGSAPTRTAEHSGSAELSANPFGLYDLYGNVWEWCWDWHGEYAAETVSDPTGSAAGSGRVLRGGAFYDARFHLSFRVPRRDPAGGSLRPLRVSGVLWPLARSFQSSLRRLDLGHEPARRRRPGPRPRRRTRRHGAADVQEGARSGAWVVAWGRRLMQISLGPAMSALAAFRGTVDVATIRRRVLR